MQELAGRFPWVDRVEAATTCYPREELHLVGVSGGLDSRVLLHLLPMVGFRGSLGMAVATGGKRAFAQIFTPQRSHAATS